MRNSQEIAKTAIIHGALAFRASLEVTDHPRCVGLCSQLPIWIEQLDLASAVEECHREIFNTAHGLMADDLRREAYWRGESAFLLGWSINLLPCPPEREHCDPNQLVAHLKILRPEARELIRTASRRNDEQIMETCVTYLAIRNRFNSLFLQRRQRALFDQVFSSKLVELGVNDKRDTTGILERAHVFANSNPSTQGLYVIRSIAAEWLLENPEEAV